MYHFRLTLAAVLFTIFMFAGGSAAFSQMEPDFWEQTNAPLSIEALTINSNGNIFVGSSGVFRSMDNGDTWSEVNAGLTGRSTPRAFAINANGDIFAGNIRGVFRSTDNGDNWIELNAGLTNTFIGVLAVNNNDVLFAGTLSGTSNGVPIFGSVFRSTDNGDNWRSSGLDSNSVWTIAINDSNDIFAGTDGGAFRSTDNGDTWSEINAGLTSGNVVAFAINANGDIFAGTDGGAFRSTDNGDTWSESNAGLTGSAKALTTFGINANGDIFAGTIFDGVFRSTDNGDNWSAINTGLPTTARVNSLAINSSGQIFAGTDSHGVFRSVESTTAVEEFSVGLPSSFMLQQNYPNPFNPTTVITFLVSFGVISKLSRIYRLRVSHDVMRQKLNSMMKMHRCPFRSFKIL